MRFSMIVTDEEWARLEGGAALTARPRDRPGFDDTKAARLPQGVASRSGALGPYSADMLRRVMEETAHAWLREELATRIGPPPAGVVEPLRGWADWGRGKGVPDANLLWQASMSGREEIELSGLEVWILCEVPDARVALVDAGHWRSLAAGLDGGLVPLAVQEARHRLLSAFTVAKQGPWLEARACERWRAVFVPHRGRGVRDARVRAILWSLRREDVVEMEEMPLMIGI